MKKLILLGASLFVFQTTSAVEVEAQSPNLPCYEAYNNTTTAALAAYALCVYAAGSTGIGLIACSAGLAAAFYIADNEYNNCLSNNYNQQ